jgi:uncharacterized protein (UPF0276 family)
MDLRAGRLLRAHRRRKLEAEGLKMTSAVATCDVIGAGDTLLAGVGLRLPHLAEVATCAHSVGWLEIHPENFLANPHARELLLQIAEHYPISMHTVGISIGSAEGLDRKHLSRIRQLVDDLGPILVSGHLAWSTHQGNYLNDLLPLPYDDETLHVVAAHVHEVQDVLGRRYLVENPASYVGFGASTMTEVQFLSELASLTGCQLLCDVSNVFLSAANMGYDAYAYIDAFPADAVGELHLGGFTREAETDAPGDEVLIDTHAAPIDARAWALYAHALRRFGARPTLIEWDNDLPTFATLLAEAARADSVAAGAMNEVQAHAVVG